MKIRNMNNYLEKSKHSDDYTFDDSSEVGDNDTENLERIEGTENS